MLAKVQFS